MDNSEGEWEYLETSPTDGTWDEEFLADEDNIYEAGEFENLDESDLADGWYEEIVAADEPVEGND